MAILFTQYIRPHGRAEPVKITLSPEIEAKAHKMLDQGFHFDIEILTTGEISMTCEHPSFDAPISMEVCNNDERVPDYVVKLIDTARVYWEKHREKFPLIENEWRLKLAWLETKVNSEF